MPASEPVDGFSLAYDRVGAGPGTPPVLLLHGWPGLRGDQALVAERLAGRCDAVVPDLRGFGETTGPADAPVDAFGAKGDVASLLGLLDELGLDDVVVSGYDVGSRVAQLLARTAPGRVRGVVVAPPLPGAGPRVLEREQLPEWWYQHLHQLPLVEDALDGRDEVVRAYVTHFWEHWSGPGFTPPPTHLEAVLETYARPGALARSVSWYRAGAGTVMAAAHERVPAPEDRLAVPVRALWPAHDPLFPPAWSDRLGEFLSDVEVEHLPDAGHFVPLEAPDAVAAAIGRLLPAQG